MSEIKVKRANLSIALFADLNVPAKKPGFFLK